MMEAVASSPPPFERFYLEHRDAVLAFLRRRLPRDGADDAFQETFLRALRAYGRLAHTENLRGWIITIASRVAIDSFPKLPQGDEVPDLESVDEPPAYEQLQGLTEGLPPKERAAVVLRYGYDLDYTTIGDAIGSSADAARQAASSGVRRIRKKESNDRQR
jgi:RNA polymerase sigma factor (sigma-70 family)